MNPFEQMELKKMSFTKKEMEVYKVFSENIDDILRESATAMAEKYHVSQPAITRFCQKLGYQGYNDFKFDVYKYYKGKGGTGEIATAIDYYGRLIPLIPRAVSEEEFVSLAEQIVSARYVAVCGYHKSSLPAQLLDINLSKMGILSSFVRADCTDSIVSRSSRDDLVIFFSARSGAYRDAADSVQEKPEDQRPATVLITQSDKHPIRNKVDRVIWLPSYLNQGYPQYLEAQVAPIIFVDLLTSYVTNCIKEDKQS